MKTEKELAHEKMINSILAPHIKNRSNNVRIFYGDIETGRDWLEENDTVGRVYSSRNKDAYPCMCNSAILSHCVVKITVGFKTIYQHENYHHAKLEIVNNPFSEYTHTVSANGEAHACFKSEGEAIKFIQFIKGERNRL